MKCKLHSRMHNFKPSVSSYSNISIFWSKATGKVQRVHAFIEIGIPRNFFPNSYSPFQCTNICIVPHTHTHIYVFVLSTASSNLCYRSPSLLPPPSPAHPQPQQGSKAEVLIYIQKQVLAQRQNEGRLQETTHLCSSQCSFPHLVVIRAG